MKDKVNSLINFKIVTIAISVSSISAVHSSFAQQPDTHVRETSVIRFPVYKSKPSKTLLERRSAVGVYMTDSKSPLYNKPGESFDFC